MSNKILDMLKKAINHLRFSLLSETQELPMVMTEKEKELFLQEAENASHYLEFGSGGSTLAMLKYSRAKIHAVESDLNWLEQLRSHRRISHAEKTGRLMFFHADIGPTKKWGFPKDNQYKERFPIYSSGIFSTIDNDHIDFALVDGRFRVACVLQVLLNCHRNKRLKIAIHDFWNREQYHVLLPFLQPYKTADSLGIFKPAKAFNRPAMEQLYESHRFVKK